MDISLLAALFLLEAFGWLLWAVLSGFFARFRRRALYLLAVLVTAAVCAWLFFGIVGVKDFPLYVGVAYLIVHIGWVVERVVVLRAHDGIRLP